ncbi:MAG: three-Cys-motif partner protein TcmP [Minwuia sp.]|uniref:three-Cys-motif partner protein TcmP n=1 Tax=Minwuia sp. TaxID=2493630 RepID=UPI003A86F016
MAQRTFGSTGSTGKKLAVIESYLQSYQIALSRQHFHTMYIDGFAGSGEVPQRDTSGQLLGNPETQTVLAGSAVRAAEIEPPFDRYVFIEARRAAIEALRGRFAAHRRFASMEFKQGDANAEIQELCAMTSWANTRAIVFLDPFGNQVAWETIEVIAATKAIDLWYLFPAGLGVFRQISADGGVTPEARASITRLLGTAEWETAFVDTSEEPDLFSDSVERRSRNVTSESVAKFMAGRMNRVFAGGVLDQMIPLGTRGFPWYYLIFALANPSDRARGLATKLAKGVLKASQGD